MKNYFFILFQIGFFFLISERSKAQDCNVLSKANDLIPDKECAPVTVQWSATYRGVNGTNIQFRYEWDHLNEDGTPAIDIVTPTQTAPGEYTFTQGHVYPQGMDRCAYRAEVFLVVDGTICTSSVQPQTITVWDMDDFNGGNLYIEPQEYRICAGFGAEVIFQDNSHWNCTPPEENDIVNSNRRWLQWVYGTDQSNPIPGVSVNNNTAFPFASPVPPRATHQPITAPPADMVSDIITVPPTNINDVGKYFEITLNNWNYCNPYPGNAPRRTTARIIIVDAPHSDFQTRLNNASGSLRNEFCIGDLIYFQNLTAIIPDSDFAYRWEMYDNPHGTGSPAVSNRRHPTHTYQNAGQKLIRLTVTDRNVEGACNISIEKTINITPTPIARIQLLNESGSDITSNAQFCYNSSAPEVISITFNDITTGTNANSRWRWEFYDAEGNLTESLPSGGGVYPENSAAFSSNSLSGFSREFSAIGSYKSRLIVLDEVTECFTDNVVYINIFGTPEAGFSFTTVCSGEATGFFDQSALTDVVNGDHINLWEWDWNYDGNEFNVDLSFNATNQPQQILHTFPQAGVYQVALRITTSEGACSDFITKEVTVLPNPVAIFEKDIDEACSGTEVTFTNSGHHSQPDGVSMEKYIWLVDGTAVAEFAVEDPDFSTTYVHHFINTENTENTYEVMLKAVGANGCITESAPQQIKIFPAPQSGFIVSGYDPYSSNCSPIEGVQFTPNDFTRSLNIQKYIWTISTGNEAIAVIEKDNPNEPDFHHLTYDFENTTNNVINYHVRLEVELDDNSCVVPSNATIRVDPVPSSAFDIVQREINCEFMVFDIEARQKGLRYQWTIHPQPYNHEHLSYDDRFTAIFERPQHGQPYMEVEVALSTLNSNNCESTISEAQITVPSRESVTVELSMTSPVERDCPPFTANFRNGTYNAPAGIQYALSVFLNGEHISEQETKERISGNLESDFAFDFDRPGNYEIFLKATSEDGCEFITPHPIQIEAFPVPEAVFAINRETGCSPLEISYTENSVRADHKEWYIYDLTDNELVYNSLSDVPDYTFINTSTEVKDYEIRLVVTTANGCSDEEAKVISIAPQPQTDFEILSENAGCHPYEISFRNTSVFPENTTFTWYWGNGTSSVNNDEVVTHTFVNNSYTTSRTITVRLQAETPQGCIASTSRQITLNPQVTANFHPNVTQGCAPLIVSFENYSLGNDGAGSAWYYEVEGSDSWHKFSDEPSTTYTFANNTADHLIYNVHYIAENTGGCRDTLSRQITVYPVPDVHFVATPVHQVWPENTIHIENRTAPGNWIYEWDFGDGQTSSSPDPATHMYARFGTYTITLTVQGEHCQGTYQQQIIIEPLEPVVDFAYTPNGCRPLTVHFTNLSQFTDPQTYEWDFGDNMGTSRAENPSYTYYNAGVYSVKLKARNHDGKEVEVVKENIIVVHDIPIAAFQVRPNRLYLRDVPLTTVNVSTNASSYYWDFGDGNTSTEFEPKHFYEHPGQYTITLIAENEYGCTDTLIRESLVIVEEGGNVRVPNAFTPNTTGPTGGNINSGGLNDIFYPITESVTEFNMQIFNRWGELIFESNSPNIGWDGYHKGRLCKADVYVYRITMKYVNGTQAVRVGDVTLIR